MAHSAYVHIALRNCLVDYVVVLNSWLVEARPWFWSLIQFPFLVWIVSLMR